MVAPFRPEDLPVPADANILLEFMEQKTIECAATDEDWALAQMRGWNIISNGPKRIALENYDTTRLVIVAQRLAI